MNAPENLVSGEGGRLAENIMHFARCLRAAGLPLGPGRVIAAVAAVERVGLTRRDDFYWTLHAVFVNRRDQQEIFDQAFHVFWRNPRILERLMSLMLPTVRPDWQPDDAQSQSLSPRLAETMKLAGPDTPTQEQEDIEIDAVLTWSQKEVLASRDFEKMTSAEVTAAKRAIEGLRLPIAQVPTRRFRPDPRGRRADLRASFRSALRSGSNSIPLRWRKRRRRPPPLVVLCDISGSMSRYSRLLLHFMHAISNDRDRVSSFVFGTRLTNVTRYLRHKDVDVALDRIGHTVADWAGGTRIGTALHCFNNDWSRRVLGQGAIVLLVTDGLDRDNAEGLSKEMERLHKSARRVIWLNPLLRYDRYEPKSMGAQAMLPHVDELRTVHNLESLGQLRDILSQDLTKLRRGGPVWQAKVEAEAR